MMILVIIAAYARGATPVDREEPRQPAHCATAGHDQLRCYKDYYFSLAKTRGIPSAFGDLKTRSKDNPYIKSQCHVFAHAIGQAASRNFQNLAEAFAAGDSFCWSGYFHGVVEEIVNRRGKASLIHDIDDICVNIGSWRKNAFDHYNCVHGIGHGLMMMTNHELFESLEMCDLLTNKWDQSSCWSGVFMENIIAALGSKETSYLNPSDPVYPCNAVADQYKETCYLMQTSYMLDLHNADFVKVFELCAHVEENYIVACYQSLGRDASGHTAYDVTQTRELCLLGKHFYQQFHCIIGAVKDFISYYRSDIQAHHLCESLPHEMRSQCSNEVRFWKGSFGL